MIIYNSGDKIKHESAVMLGMFDGLHIGHKKLVEKAKKAAEADGLQTVLFTFSTNPKAGGKSLITNEKKAELCENAGIDSIYFQDFTEDFRQLSPEGFMGFLKTRLNARTVIAGFDYRFGFKHSGNVETLKKGDFKLFVVPEITLCGEKVSSSTIRKLIEKGDVEGANAQLGYPFPVEGIVENGRSVGRNLGFRTANLAACSGTVIPGRGVYATKTIADKKSYMSVTNIGTKPTFGLDYTTVETHILGFDGSLYGKKITIEFHRRLRDEVAFSSPKELSEQIERDVNAVKTLFGGSNL